MRGLTLRAALRSGGSVVMIEGPGGQRTAGHVLAEARELVEPAQREAVGRLPGRLRLIAGYHAGWWDAEGRPCGGLGKAVRPALVLACARSVDPDRERAVRRALPAAVAVELVHDFTLLHDDVMDGDPVRRHRAAAWTVFGMAQAVLAGDALLALAWDILASWGVRAQPLAGAVLRGCGGQSADLSLPARSAVTLGECLRMAEDKTGVLLGAACELGALAAGADDATAECYRDFGRHVGVAFQLVDDLLGIWGEAHVTGKPVGANLTARKRSLPVVAALTSGTAAGERLAELYQHFEPFSERELLRVVDLIEAAGGRHWAVAEADRRTQQALDCLERAAPRAGAAYDLKSLARLLTRRDH